MPGYLIYHPKRVRSTFDDIVVYHDNNKGNQDPYVWNKPFLHTFCHITQMSPKKGYINFWVTADKWKDITHLHCDLVFYVKEMFKWNDTNKITPDNTIVDSEEAFTDHYQWAWQHKFKKRDRYTLKADPIDSFQPQNEEKNLIDLVPILTKHGFSKEKLSKDFQCGFGSKPILIDDKVTNDLYSTLKEASIKLFGNQLAEIRKKNKELASIDSGTSCTPCGRTKVPCK